MTPTQIAEAQLEAYNAQDLDRFCSYFTDDVVVADFNGKVTSEGIGAYRERYAGVFAQFPKNRVILRGRMEVGATVIDHEYVIRGPEGPEFEVIAVYTCRGDKIARVDFIR